MDREDFCDKDIIFSLHVILSLVIFRGIPCVPCVRNSFIWFYRVVEWCDGAA